MYFVMYKVVYVVVQGYFIDKHWTVCFCDKQCHLNSVIHQYDIEDNMGALVFHRENK